MPPPSTDLQRLLAEEPFVRALASHLLAEEPDDVVQQVFLRALQHRPATLGRPRSWLARVVRNLVTDHRRQRRHRVERERRAALTERVPSAAALAELDERRSALVTAVNELPDGLRTLVLLRYYEGLPPRRIAAELDLPVTVVWERLRQALQQLRRRLDQAHGDDRRAWLLPLVPLTVRPRCLPWRELLRPTSTATSWTGALAMTTKTNLAIATAALALLAATWVAWPHAQGTERDLDGKSIAAAAATTRRDRPVADAPPDAPERAAVTAPAPVVVTTGSLRLRVRYADEPRPAVDVLVNLNRPGGDFRVDVRRARTDAAGTAQFDAVPAGSWVVTTGRAHRQEPIEILAGQANEGVLDLQRGMDVSGVVVDRWGAPIAGALVELGEARRHDPEVAATTGPDGTFALRGCPSMCLVGARATGHAASSLLHLVSHDGSPQRVRIELAAAGGVVEGVVVCDQGAPVSGAVVRVGEGPTDDLAGYVGTCPPLPAQVRTGADGRFRAVGVPVGTQPVQVRSVGFAPWRGSCAVGANVTVPLRVMLGAGGACAGAVVTEAGAPIADAIVRVGGKGDFVQLFARTAPDGSFVLRDLPVGEVELTAAVETLGRASAKVVTSPGSTARCELRLSGLLLRGRLVDETDQPVTWTPIRVSVEGGEARSELATTDGDGRFRVPFLPKGYRVTIELVNKRTFGPVRRAGIDPAAGEALVRVQRAPRSARVRGVVLDADAAPATNVTVMAPDHPAVVTRADGSFEIGPLPAGAAWLYFEKDGYATYRSASFTLLENASVDLGTVRLHRGGTVRVEVSGAAAEQLGFFAHAVAGEGVSGTGLVATTVPVRSIPLNPGSYELRVNGKGFAPERLPFVIRDGEETALTVVVTAGTEQRFEFVVPAGDAAPDRVAFDVRRAETVVWSATARADRGFTVEVSLALGDYEVVVTESGQRGSARFTVGRAPGPPVLVQVR